MNRLKGTISTISQSGSIALVDVNVDGHGVSALIIDLPQRPVWLRTGNSIGLIFKETEVILGKHISGLLSMGNQLPCVVQRVERGEILSVIDVLFAGRIIRSAMMTRSADVLTIAPGDTITAFIQANEIILSEHKD